MKQGVTGSPTYRRDTDLARPELKTMEKGMDLVIFDEFDLLLLETK